MHGLHCRAAFYTPTSTASVFNRTSRRRMRRAITGFKRSFLFFSSESMRACDARGSKSSNYLHSQASGEHSGPDIVEQRRAGEFGAEMKIADRGKHSNRPEHPQRTGFRPGIPWVSKSAGPLGTHSHRFGVGGEYRHCPLAGCVGSGQRCQNESTGNSKRKLEMALPIGHLDAGNQGAVENADRSLRSLTVRRVFVFLS
jgi:hypothetical protein